MKSFYMSLFILFFTQLLNGQCALACNDFTNFAIDTNILTEVEADVILEGNYDNCVNFAPVVSLKDLASGTDIPTSPYIGSAQVGTEVLATVTDLASGNSCWGRILVESIGSLSSGIRRCTGEKMTNVTLTMTSDDPNHIIDEGACHFNGNNLLEYVNCVAAGNQISDHSNYVITVKNNQDSHLNGVSTLDQVLIQRHILGISKFGDACKEIAADVTNDNSITAFDMLILRNIILGIFKEFPNSASWKFFNAAALSNSGSVTGQEDLKFKQEEFPLSSLEIIGVKVGDVNDTATSGN